MIDLNGHPVLCPYSIAGAVSSLISPAGLVFISNLILRRAVFLLKFQTEHVSLTLWAEKTDPIF